MKDDLQLWFQSATYKPSPWHNRSARLAVNRKVRAHQGTVCFVFKNILIFYDNFNGYSPWKPMQGSRSLFFSFLPSDFDYFLCGRAGCVVLYWFHRSCCTVDCMYIVSRSLSLLNIRFWYWGFCFCLAWWKAIVIWTRVVDCSTVTSFKVMKDIYSG